jgi:acetyl esterase/lipase
VAPGPHRYAYGDHPAQVADLHLPDAHPAGVVVLIHGGYWRVRYDRSLQHPVITDLLAHGWAAWNVDYRGVDPDDPAADGGGWPGTFLDVAAALDHLADVVAQHSLPADRIGILGHSAGGTLALWVAARPDTPAPPRIRPRAVVAQSAICDLVAGAHSGLGDGAVLELMGGWPSQVAHYPRASPTALLPLGIPVLAITGADDDTVPPSQSSRFVDAARAAGDDARLVVHPGEDHYAPLDPASAVWRDSRDWLFAALNRPVSDRPGAG